MQISMKKIIYLIIKSLKIMIQI